MNKKTLIILFLISFLAFFCFNFSEATNLPLRDIARGEPKIKVGEKAPLDIPELKKAHPELEDTHKEGKIIVRDFIHIGL